MILLFSLPWETPVDDIKNYFGEKIGLYFVFLKENTTWLIVPAIVGFFTWIYIAVDGFSFLIFNFYFFLSSY
jgi:predicted membrane-bound mannosyltransferase